MSEAADSEDRVLASSAAWCLAPGLARRVQPGGRSQAELDYVAARVAEARAILSAPADVERAPARSVLRDVSIKPRQSME